MDLKVSQQALIEACKQLDISYSIIHRDQILIRVDLEPPLSSLFFVHHKKAFDREDMVTLCRDKDLFYTLVEGKINIPAWKSFLDPYCNEKFRHYAECSSFAEIVKWVSSEFRLPVIMKKNKGAMGSNVFLCNKCADIRNAVNQIFDHGSRSYDYVVIAQEYIKLEHEYRVVVYNRKIRLVYEKDVSKAKFAGNLSPLHWDGAKAKMIKDPKMIDCLERFIQPVFDVLPIKFVGLDVGLTLEGKLFLIEANNSPGFAIFVRDNGMEKLVEMTRGILEDYIQEQKNK